MGVVSNPVLVIGAGSGIGECLTRRLIASGSSVVAAGRNQGRLDVFLKSFDGGVSVAAEAVDATDENSVEQLAMRIREKFGTLSGIVNCAGTVLLKPAHLTSVADFDLTFAVNVRSCFLLLKFCLPLIDPSGGSVVFFSTAAARAGLANHDVIVAAKSAVEGLTRAAAASYAPKKIRINAVAPGLVRTPLTERIHGNPASAQASAALHALGRLGEPDEIAALAAWLLSDESSWMTGQVIAFDGGLSLRTK